MVVILKVQSVVKEHVLNGMLFKSLSLIFLNNSKTVAIYKKQFGIHKCYTPNRVWCIMFQYTAIVY